MMQLKNKSFKTIIGLPLDDDDLEEVMSKEVKEAKDHQIEQIIGELDKTVFRSQAKHTQDLYDIFHIPIAHIESIHTLLALLVDM